jgi:pectinesterase
MNRPQAASILAVMMLLAVAADTHAAVGIAPLAKNALQQPDAWFTSVEGCRLVDNVLSWQNANGGWWKNYDTATARATSVPARPDDAPAGDTEDVWHRASTFDNGATYSEMRLLARAARVRNKPEYRQAFNRGLKFIFDAQYANGGWPQRFPLQDNYGRHITFNDNAMLGVMELLDDVARARPDFAFVSEIDRKRAAEAFDRGIDCILKCQIKVNGKLTAWCEQHDEITFAPAKARSYELPSISGDESAGITLLLMRIEKPDAAVRDAIDHAVQWYDASKIAGKRYEKLLDASGAATDRVLIDDPAGVIWARFYEIETNRPFFCKRDGVKHYALSDLDRERRAGYAWYGDWGAPLPAAYKAWKERMPAAADAPIAVASDGSGQFKTVQAAIDSIPSSNAERRVILIKPGVYKERIIVPKDKPMITLKGAESDPAGVVLTNDWNAGYTPPAATRPVGTSGSASTNIDAADFIAENLTFENSAGDHGQAVALKTMADRLIFRNCRLLGWQDTLYADTGRQYFVDCYIEGHVDFIFGGATAVFDRCTIHSKNGGYVTAARTKPNLRFGYVFLDCTLTGDSTPTFLGRPWQWDRGSKAAVAFIRCKMGQHIRPEGWNPWDLKDKPNTSPADNTRYSEFGSMDLYGHPLDVSRRVAWSHQLSSEQAAEYTVAHILGGEDHWAPR